MPERTSPDRRTILAHLEQDIHNIPVGGITEEHRGALLDGARELFMTGGLPTRSYVDLSTAHISEHDNELLTQRQQPPYVYPNEYGFFVIVPDPTDDADALSRMADAGYSPEFRQLIERLQQQGCDLLRLDRDGPPLAQLPTFDW